MALTHERGPVGGILKPSDNPIGIETAPVLFSGVRPAHFFVTPLTRNQYQEDKNSCTAHGETRWIENVARGMGARFQVCRADVYSGGLYLDGSEGRDVGVTLGSVRRFIGAGVLSEWERPYKSDDVTRRSDARLDLRRVRGFAIAGLPKDVDAIKDALLVSGGVPFGQEVRTNYAPDGQGVVRPPAGTLDGYHDTALEGWDDDYAGGCFLMANSWARWGVDHVLADVDARFAHLRGKRGFCWMPYEWINNDGFFEPAYGKGAPEVA